jgi:hypothetical protein
MRTKTPFKTKRLSSNQPVEVMATLETLAKAVGTSQTIVVTDAIRMLYEHAKYVSEGYTCHYTKEGEPPILYHVRGYDLINPEKLK